MDEVQLKAVEKEESSDAVKVAWWWKEPVEEMSKRKTSEESPTQTMLVLSGETEQWFMATGSLIVPSLFHLSTFQIFTEWSLLLPCQLLLKKSVLYPMRARRVPSRAEYRHMLLLICVPG